MTITGSLTWACEPELAVTAWIELNASHIEILTASPVFTEDFKDTLRRARSLPPPSGAFTGEGQVDLWKFKFEAVVSNVMERILNIEYERLGKRLHYIHWFAGSVLKAWNVRNYVKDAMYATASMKEAGMEWFGPSSDRTREWECLSYSAGSAMHSAACRLWVDLGECGFSEIRPYWGSCNGRSLTSGISKATDLWEQVKVDIPKDIGDFSENLELSLLELGKELELVRTLGKRERRKHKSYLYSVRRAREDCDRLTKALIDIPIVVKSAIESMWYTESKLGDCIDKACSRFIVGYIA